MTMGQPDEPLISGIGRVAAAAPCLLIIFGASGDLARRKLIPALYNLRADGLLPQVVVLGLGRRRLDYQEFRSSLRDAVRHH